MKGPHAAALAAGWLAVALSMAALATAAISRVGTQSSGAQAQVTITMTATVRATSARTATSSSAQIPSAAGTAAEPTIDITQAGLSSTVRRTTVAPPAVIATAPAAPTIRPIVTVPSISVLLPSTPTPTPTATTQKPTATRPPKTPTSSATSKDTVEASGTASESWWKQRQGRICADCRSDELAHAEAWAASGYRVTKSSTWIRTAIFFDGASPVTVLVGCHDGHATFSTSG
ncbi:MAG: hypothetical protein ACOH16_09570 [Propionibacteriaceae bacterium]